VTGIRSRIVARVVAIATVWLAGSVAAFAQGSAIINQDAVAAERTMLQTVGQSVLMSNAILVCGFAVTAVSQFPPARDFGVLTAGSIAASLVAAWFVLPSLLGLLHVDPE
jgi:predicted RND superfamily exporter protein